MAKITKSQKEQIVNVFSEATSLKECEGYILRSLGVYGEILVSKR